MTRERVAQYQDILNTEGTNLARLEQERTQAQEGIAEAEEAIQTLQEELKELTEEMEEKTKHVDEVKKTTSKAAKVLDQAIKEIATHVSLRFWPHESGRMLRSEGGDRTTRLRRLGWRGRRSTGSAG